MIICLQSDIVLCLLLQKIIGDASGISWDNKGKSRKNHF